jgi:hypothetical protein
MDPAEPRGWHLDDAHRRESPMAVSRTFTLQEARALLPDVQDKAREFIGLRADVTEVAAAINAGVRSSLGGMPEVKGWEARLHELIEWFVDKGLEPKGLAPLLLDFPSEIGGEPALLCWLEGESELAWWHRPDHGFGGRRPIAL